MSFNLFGRKKSSLLKSFLVAVKKGERDFLSLLGTHPEKFREASFEELMSNEDDVLARVNRVQVNFNNRFFEFFDGCLIKHNDAGDVEYIFVTTSSDAPRIIQIADILFEELGHGYFDNLQFSSFHEHEKIRDLAQGRYTKPSDAPMQNWFHDNLAIGLYYRIVPLRQLSFSVTIKAPEVKDNSVRRKGTILNLLHFDPVILLSGEPIHQVEEYSGDTVKFVDYTYALEPKEMGLFNAVDLRIFGNKRVFDKFLQTHITLYTVGPVDPDQKIAVVEILYRIYGNDNSNSSELEFYERSKLENGTFWVGRTWRFNEAHAPHDLNNRDEKISYEVRVDNMEDTQSFKISISGYNNLVALFGES